MQYLVWEDDPEGLKERMDRFLSIASRHGVSAMVILFCDCFFGGRDPYLGPQDGPVPGVHNSQWVPSPGFERLADRDAWPGLERYVKDIVGSFGTDPRVLVWDLYNEPDDELRSQPLVEDAFAWARSASPMQPLTTGPWTWNAFEDDLSSRLFELSDIVTFHYYGAAEDIGPSLDRCHAHGRPVICTEWAAAAPRQHLRGDAARFRGKPDRLVQLGARGGEDADLPGLGVEAGRSHPGGLAT